MPEAIYTISAEGNLKNIGRDFKSYETDIVHKCAALFLGDDAREYKFKARKLGQSRSSIHYDFDCNKVVIYAVPTPAAHAAVLRLLALADCDELSGYCFVVTECGKTHNGLHGVFTSREALEAYVAKQPQEVADELFVRIVPFNAELV